MEGVQEQLTVALSPTSPRPHPQPALLLPAAYQWRPRLAPRAGSSEETPGEGCAGGTDGRPGPLPDFLSRHQSPVLWGARGQAWLPLEPMCVPLQKSGDWGGPRHRREGIRRAQEPAGPRPQLGLLGLPRPRPTACLKRMKRQNTAGLPLQASYCRVRRGLQSLPLVPSLPDPGPAGRKEVHMPTARSPGQSLPSDQRGAGRGGGSR